MTTFPAALGPSGLPAMVLMAASPPDSPPSCLPMASSLVFAFSDIMDAHVLTEPPKPPVPFLWEDGPFRCGPTVVLGNTLADSGPRFSQGHLTPHLIPVIVIRLLPQQHKLTPYVSSTVMPPEGPGKRPPKPKDRNHNPITTAVKAWLLATLPSHGEELGVGQEQEAVLSATAPKRWVVYEPMVLLPSGSFGSAAWADVLERLSAEAKGALWRRILDEMSRIAKEPLTHLAINEGIPLLQHDDGTRGNILRSPTGLRMLYGDFGPASCPMGRDGQTTPAPDDLKAAFWVSVCQNGIHQAWAPRWTMFSRGNIKEKARLLAFHAPQTPGTAVGLAHRAWPAAQLASTWAVDLYAGIGYFAFSYAKLGLRVLCWELNPWSVEGLRRGAARNGWSVAVVQGADLARPTAEVAGGGQRIVVFLEDNREAARRVQELRSAGTALDVSHVNCGLLPGSQASWRAAWDILGPRGEGWLHLHENIGAGDVEDRRAQVQKLFRAWNEGGDAARDVSVEHVELVKTFAPGVWHCVLDVSIRRI